MTKPLSKSQAGESTELAHNAVGQFGALAQSVGIQAPAAESLQAGGIYEGQN
jgi:hypothetical protein